MRLTFLGADHEVTGSCHLLTGMWEKYPLSNCCAWNRANDVYENQELPVPASDVDYVLLTHAHTDHSGLDTASVCERIPWKRCCRQSRRCSCAEIMLKDSAHIQMFEAENGATRKAKRSDGTLKEFACTV